MTTAARLVAALCLAFLAFVGSRYIMTRVMPETTAFGGFLWLNLLLGLTAGWRILGTRVGRGMANGISAGITATAMLVLWGILAQAIYEMFRLAMRHRYDGPAEAFVAIFDLALDFGAHLLDGGFIGLMVLGAVLSGALAELAARNWR
ncbi:MULTISPECIES: TrgA family protein [Roseobacteraceae]|uniref:TrgA family protein n=1 Tax=Roseobacteraceae TaxID=2854170 RepID=UPI0013B9EC9F|nr:MULTISPECIES: TrgA family protein [unclassified Salipiger]NDV51821.1 TrgA family protein [Salipiger sp. PrR003]NDW31898.1 TrgA family protein [Salipiger sp. PrR007]